MQVLQYPNFKRPNRTHAQILTLHGCGLDSRKDGVLSWLGRSPATRLSSLCRDLNELRNRSLVSQATLCEGCGLRD